MSGIFRRRCSEFGALGAANISTVANLEAGQIHAEFAASAVRDATHYGQRGDLLFAVDFIYIHIQVSITTIL